MRLRTLLGSEMFNLEQLCSVFSTYADPLRYIPVTCFMITSCMPLPIHPRPFSSPLSGTTQVSWYQKGKTYLAFTEARDSEWQWQQLHPVQLCKSASCFRQITMPAPHHSVFLQAGCPSCRPTNSVKALMHCPYYRLYRKKTDHSLSDVV